MPAQLDLSDIALKALHTEGGVAYVFGNKKEALAFRSRFYTFKAKELRHQRRIGSQTTVYDPLGCFLEQTSEGWRLTIKQALVDGAGWFAAKTGEAIDWPNDLVDTPAEPLTPRETPEELIERMRKSIHVNQGN